MSDYRSARLVLIGLLFIILVVCAQDPPRQSNGLTDIVQWDSYSLFVHNQRVFLHSGEFHAFRLPVPDLWLDIFQKAVAAGLNGISLCIPWGLLNPSPGVFDFDGWRALQPYFDAARQAGLFVVVRPGPYLNAETTAGGVPLWVTSTVPGEFRTNATQWTETYRPWTDKIINATVNNQVTEGGPVLFMQVDNEYSQSPDTHAEYFAQLEDQYRAGGIVVPLTYNDPGPNKNFINGTGAVDIYGLDSYPQGFNCSNPRQWLPVITTYRQYHLNANPSEPFYIPEFQGGAFDPWGGPGYDACAILTGADFENVFYKHNWASNAKLINYYMFYGGTSWGGIPYPGVYTSYDYGSAIREARALTDKYDELKRQAMFIRSSPSFRKTDWIGDSNTTVPGVTVSGDDADAVYVTLLRNPDDGTGFYIVRQADSTSTARAAFNLTVPTSRGTFKIPMLSADGVVLDGRQSKMLLTDYNFGASSTLVYSTAAVFFAGKIGRRDVTVLYGDVGQEHEFALVMRGRGTRAALETEVVRYGTLGPDSGPNSPGDESIPSLTTVSFRPTPGTLLPVWNSDTQLILVADTVTAGTLWAPPIRAPTDKTIAGLESFWQFGTNETVLIGGPYLVRNATIENKTLHLRGDLNRTTSLLVVAPPEVAGVMWNGRAVEIERGVGGIFRGTLELRNGLTPPAIPKLEGWRFADSLPEIKQEYIDDGWVVANHTTTIIDDKALFGDGTVLYGCDYGFCEGNVLWRGHFFSTGAETGVNLTINGGTAFAASVWLNDVFLGTIYNGSAEVNAILPFPKNSLLISEENVITVLQDHMGNDEKPNEKSPRGIRGFELIGGANFTTWKVQGKFGGYTAYPDKTRGVWNEGGLYGERMGWHLPGFDTSGAEWSERNLEAGLPGGKAGVGFFVTTFELSFPEDSDVLVSFQFEEDMTQPYRALLFANGWKYGKRVANVGPQSKFPVPPGILDRNGMNTVAVAVWVLDDVDVSPKLELVVDGILDGGVGPVKGMNPAWEFRVAG